MILDQHYLGCLAQASYLIGDQKSGEAAVVDPRRDVDLYLQEADRLGLKIRAVLLTHFHADFVAGHLELRDRCGATIYLGGRARAEYPFEPLREGDTLTMGRVRLKILETPGHTPEGISILVFDRDRDEERPHAVLTGDTLFIGDVGRPDLMASVGVTAKELAGMLYDSLHEKLLKLPDETLVYPGHGAGSMCGKNLSNETVSTIGDQRRFNYALQPMSRSRFIEVVTADQPEAPGYFAFDAELNRKERTTLDVSLDESLRALPLDRVLKEKNAGAQIVDVREPAAFAGSHLAGAINIGLDGKFATWAGTVLSRERSIIIIAEPGREEEAAVRLGRIGLDRVGGYLEGGMAALETRPDLVRRSVRVTAPDLETMLRDDEPPLVLDVRAAKEVEGARIKGSVNIPLGKLESRLEEVPRDRMIAVHCATGYRSSIASSLLELHGFDRVVDLVGGIAAWRAATGPA